MPALCLSSRRWMCLLALLLLYKMKACLFSRLQTKKKKGKVEGPLKVTFTADTLIQGCGVVSAHSNESTDGRERCRGSSFTCCFEAGETRAGHATCGASLAGVLVLEESVFASAAPESERGSCARTEGGRGVS